jgi:hypothetical protein
MFKLHHPQIKSEIAIATFASLHALLMVGYIGYIPWEK